MYQPLEIVNEDEDENNLAGDYKFLAKIKDYWRKYWHWRNELKRLFDSSTKLFYPNRPALTILIGMAIIALAFLGMPFHFAMFLGVSVMVDDILLTPIMQIMSDVRNLKNKRKIPKSVVHLVFIGLGFLVGALLGYFVFMSMPGLIAMMPLIRAGIETSVTLFVLAGTGAMLLSRLTKISPLILMLVVGLVILAAPIPMIFPIAVDIVLASTLIFGFFASLGAKQTMKWFYKLKHAKVSRKNGKIEIKLGVGNEDGLYLDYTPAQEQQVDQQRAAVFQVKQKVAHDYRISLVAMIETINRILPYYQRVSGTQKHMVGGYKDMLHAFMRAQATDSQSKQDVHMISQISQHHDDSLRYYYDQPAKIVKNIYGSNKSPSALFSLFGASSNSYAKNAKGISFKKGMNEFYKDYAMAKVFHHDPKSMRVYEQFQDAHKAFYETATFR